MIRKGEFKKTKTEKLNYMNLSGKYLFIFSIIYPFIYLSDYLFIENLGHVLKRGEDRVKEE
jgi:hypothetical protein